MPTVQQISRKAKQIRKRGEKWLSAIRRASKMLTGKKSASKKRRKVSAVKLIERGETRSTRPRKVYRVKRSSSGTFKGTTRIAGINKASLGTLLSEARKRHKEQVDKLVLRKYHAKKKRDKKKIQKKINEHNAALRKL